MTITISGTQHMHRRPGWDCRVCGKPWPCENAKADLLEEFRMFPSVLTIYLSGHMCQALVDLTPKGKRPPDDLYERFLSWTHFA
jgi:hypothetical protein